MRVRWRVPGTGGKPCAEAQQGVEMKIRNSHGAAVLLLSTALAAAGASAGESRLAPVDTGGDIAAAKQEAALAERLRQEEVRLRAERAAYPAYFKRAYAAYPQIPRGALEAIAHVQSRWQNVRADDAGAMADHGHMPAAHGV